MKKASLTIDNEQCKGCMLCAFACPMKILEADKTVVNGKGYNPIKCVEIDACTGCAMCAIICPDSVIKVERTKL